MNIKLHMTPRSPFARRVRIALKARKIAYEEILSEPFSPTDSFLHDNPLGLVPCLTGTEVGAPISDSSLILEWIDQAADIHSFQKVYPQHPTEAIVHKLFSNYCCGIMSQAVLLFFESKRTVQDTEWRRDFMETIDRTLMSLAQSIPFANKTFEQGFEQPLTDLGIVLEYLCFRASDLKLGDSYWEKPPFKEVLEKCRTRQYFVETAPRL